MHSTPQNAVQVCVLIENGLSRRAVARHRAAIRSVQRYGDDLVQAEGEMTALLYQQH